MAYPHTLSGLALLILFLKATVKKQVWVPQYVTRKGTVVPGHHTFVHVSDAHDEHKIMAGQGTHSQKAVHAKLVKQPWFNALPHDHQVPILLEHATAHQDKASAAGALSSFKTAIMAGKVPTNGQWKAYDAAGADKKAEIFDAAEKAGLVLPLANAYGKWKAANGGVVAAPAVSVAAAPVSVAAADIAAPAPDIKAPASDIVPAPAKPSAAPVPSKWETGAVLSFDSQYQKMNAGHWKIYNQDVDNLMMHKVGATVPSGTNTVMVPKSMMEQALAIGTGTVVSSPSGAAPLPSILPPGSSSSWAYLKSTEGKMGIIAAAYKWLDANPSQNSDLASSLVDMGHIDAAKKMGIYEAPHFSKPPVHPPIGPGPAALAPVPAAGVPTGQLAAKILAAKLPATNTNHKPVNQKLQAIYDALNDGDVKTLLMHGHGSNTYAHKAVKLANEALAVLGSTHQVVAGQKMGTHAGLAGAPAAAAPALAGGTPLKDKPAYDHLSHNYKTEDAVAAAANDWLAANPSKKDELSEALSSLALFHIVKTMGLDSAVAGPQEGDTKAGANGGTLALKDGHWVLQGVAATALAFPVEPVVTGSLKAKAEVAAITASLDHFLDTGEVKPHTPLIPNSTKLLWGKVSKYAIDANAYLQSKTGKPFVALPAAPTPTLVGATVKVKPAAPASMAATAKLAQQELPPAPDVVNKHYFAATQKMALAGDVDGIESQILKLTDGAKNPKSVGYAKQVLALMKGKLAGGSFSMDIPDDDGDTGLAEADAIFANSQANANVPPDIKKMLDGKAAEGAKEYLETVAKVHATQNPHVAAYAQKLIDGLPAVAPVLSSGLPIGKLPSVPPGVNQISALKLYNLATNGDLSGLALAVGSLAKTQVKTKGYGDSLISALAKHQGGASGAPQDFGPKDGDTKAAAAGGMLVFKDGRWHKQAAPAPMVTVSHFLNNTGDHNKFWAVSVHGTQMITEYGKIGTKGTKSVKNFPSANAAATAQVKLINEKVAKGYKGDGITKVASIAASLAAAPAQVVGAATKPAAALEPTATTLTGAASIDDWTKTGGKQGYNEGGFYTAPDGSQWYCKFPAGGEKVAKNELLASKLYALAGVSNAEVKLITQGGKVGLASKIVVGAKEDKAALLVGVAPGIMTGFAVDAWLANWDAVGNNPSKGFDNILIKPDGSAVRIDAGGALAYGGAGGNKQTFGDKVIELKTMLDPAKNANTAAVFGKMTNADIASSVAFVAAIPDAMITSHCQKYGPGTTEERADLAKKLIARKADMLAQYPKAGLIAAKKKAAAENDSSWASLKPGEKVVETGMKFGVQFVKIEMPGKGFSAESLQKPWVYDKSGSAFVNKSNTDDIEKIYAFAIGGWNLNDLKFDQIEKATGKETGNSLPFSDHPSAFVREYYDAVNAELAAQLLPTYKVLHNGSILGGIANAIKEISDTVKRVKYSAFAEWKKKAADYLVLDSDGAAGLPMPEPGQFNETVPGDAPIDAFQKDCKSAFSNLSEKEQSACKSYTGSAYDSWNLAMRKGNTDSASFKTSQPMRDAFDKAAQDLPEGTILWRGIGVGEETYKSVVGAVIQDGSFQSSSYGKTPAFGSKPTYLRMHIGKGVKALHATSFSNFGTGEREIIIDRNVRYAVIGVTHHDNFIDSAGKSHGKKTIVDVMVLPHED